MTNAVQGAQWAPNSAPLRVASRLSLKVLFLAFTLALTMGAMGAPAVFGGTSTDSSPKLSQAGHVLKIARSHLGSRFRMGAEGQRIGRKTYFDCSGFVYRVFKEAGLVSKIGGARMGATSYLHWFQRRGLASKSHPKPGDLIIWGIKGHVHHIGIYVSPNRAISALVNPWGVSTHHISGLPAGAHTHRMLRVIAYLHVRISR